MYTIYKLIYKISVLMIIFSLLTWQTSCTGVKANSQNTNAVSLQAISITPDNSFTHLGISQQFIATGIYSDGSKQNITTQVQWTSSNSNAVSISNTSNGQGLAKALAVTATPVVITASLNNISASTNFSVSAAILQSVIISVPNSIIHLGINQQFSAIGVYTDGNQDITQYVTWSSSNPKIATVNSSGLVIPVSSGSVNISATTLSSLSMPKTIKLKNLKTVSAISNIGVSSALAQSVSISQTNPVIHLGTVMQFSTTATFADQSTQNISNNTVWTSSDTGVATVDNTGLITPIAAGTATINATLNTTSGATFSNTTNLTVSSASLQSIVTSPTNPIIYQGVTQQFTAIAIFSDGSQDVTLPAIWNSSNTNIATINNTSSSISGLAQPSFVIDTTANTNIIASLTSGKSTINSSINSLTVSTAKLSFITITPSLASIPKGVKQQYTAIGTFSDGLTKDITTSVIWSSENSALINISNTLGSNGLATAGNSAIGTTNINATLNGVSASTSVTIKSATLQSINITPNSSVIGIGATLQFTATGTYSDGSTLNLNTSVIWSSSNTNIASISNDTGSNGNATGVGLGSVSITATLNNISSSTLLAISSAVLKSINVYPVNSIINGIGGSLQFIAIGIYSDNSQQNLTNSVLWNESNTNVVSINNTTAQGLATAIATGSSITTATLGLISGNTAVSVVPYAYIINDTSTTAPTVCTLTTTGGLSSCTSAGGSGFNNAWAIAVSNGYAYITNSAGNNVNVCNISGGVLSSCATSGSSLSSPRGIAISNNYAYIPNNGNNTLTACTVNAGSLSGCATTGSGFTGPYGITINNGYAYVTNNGVNTVSYCVVNSGILSSCATTGSGFTTPGAIVINNGFAYVVNPGPTNTVIQCTVNLNGTLTGCVDSGAGAIFNNPFGIAINNGFAYVVNANGGGSVTKCTVNAISGVFSGCVNSGATGFATPTGIVFY